MEYIVGKKPDSFKGKLFKKVLLKSTLGRAWNLHIPFVDPASNKYFFKREKRQEA